MIFVTVGTQLPFDRLIDAMDAVAANLDEPVIAQTGTDPAGRWPHLQAHARLEPDRFEAYFKDARLVVGHAGIGTLLSAERHGTPLILVPRRHDLGEHRNAHQMATVRQLEGRLGVRVVWDEKILGEVLMEPIPMPFSGSGERQDTALGPEHARLIAKLGQILGG
ncbi:MAG: glycosyltransferase [Pseudomonadota bacterium]